MNVTQKLMQEHQLILKYLDLLKRYIPKISINHLNNNFLAKLEVFVDFIQNFADKYHHAKEENILFRHLEEPGVLIHCNPLPLMMQDHEEGRVFIRAMQKAVQTGNHASAVENATGWITVLEAHIGKEDNVLYVMAEEGLSNHQKKAILQEYEVVEVEMNGAELVRKYEQLLSDLEKYLSKG